MSVMLVSVPVINTGAALQPCSPLCAAELSERPQRSLNTNSLNLQMNSRYVGTRFRRLFFFSSALYGLSQRNKLQLTMEFHVKE